MMTDMYDDVSAEAYSDEAYPGYQTARPEKLPIFVPPQAAGSLAKRVAKAMQSMTENGRLQKNGWNDHFRFAYATSEDVKDAARAALAENEVSAR